MSLSLRRLFHKEKQERRILRQIERTGDRLEPRGRALRAPIVCDASRK